MTALPSRSSLRFVSLALVALFLVALVPQPATANPMVPYCAGSAGIPGGISNPEVCMQVTGRVFPEASAHSLRPGIALPGAGNAPAADYVSFYEFQAGLDYLAGTPEGQQFLTINEVGRSTGLCPMFGAPSPTDPTPTCEDSARDTFPIYMLELTNKESPIPIENRQSMLFMLSIHGNEKGGREGGYRVLEDLIRGIGFAAETVQGGAGMPGDLEKPTGGPVENYRDYLDFMRVFLLFPNADGWAHDELPYAVTDPYCGTLFCRGNGHGTDLNRQSPTLGWQNENRNPVGESEAIGYYNWMLNQNITWSYAIDIHGMLNHQNFGAIMLPAGSMSPQEMQRSIRLAETLKERMNAEAGTGGHFNEWITVFETGETGSETAGEPADAQCDAATGQLPPQAGGMDCPLEGSALAAAGSSQFAEYYTVIDAIGYTDSGFNGDYFAQDTGLNAPGYDIELAYNHMVADSQYEAGAMFNDYHVKMVREIVKSFMDAAALDVKISFETRGLRTAYLESQFVATNLDDVDENGTAKIQPGGWASENPGDDLWDVGENGGFQARPAKYWEDLKPFVRNGDEPGVLIRTTASQITPTYLAGFDQFIIPGSAIDSLDDSDLSTIRQWVEDGGNLVLTDQALQFLNKTGVTDGGVDVLYQYMGGIRMDLTKPVFYEFQDTSSEANRNVRGGVKQTVEPTPLGFAVGANAVPNWFVSDEALAAAGGESWGLACGTTNLNDPCAGNGVGLGRIPLGTGQIQFIGSLLPDPTEEFYHPYGLDHYATTYSGNQIVRNMLFMGNVLDEPPIVITESGEIIDSRDGPTSTEDDQDADTGGKKKDSPGAALPFILAALAAVVLLRRRR